MRKTDLLEPQNGDYIAYIEQLQQHALDSLKITNADRIAHAEEKPIPRRHLASDLLSTGHTIPSSTQTTHTQRKTPPEENHRNDNSVAEEFSTNTPTAIRRKRQSPAFAVANFFLFTGLFVIIFGVNTDLEAIAGSGFFLMMLGLLLIRTVRRHRH